MTEKEKTAICANGEVKEGDRVCTFNFDGSVICGVLKWNTGYEHLAEWYVDYDDGEDCAVLDMNYIFKETKL